MLGPAGLFLVTGPTGSGKSTSLASHGQLYQRELSTTTSSRSKTRSSFITTTRSRRSISARSASTCPAFPKRLRRALRQDPDVILVGEMRDLETIEAAITRRRNGPRRVRHAAHHSAPGHDQPHHRRVSRRTSRTRFARSFRIGDHRHPRPDSCFRRSAAAASRRTRLLVVTPGIANLIRENKTFRITSCHSNRCQARHAVCSTTTFSICGGRKVHEGRRAWQSAIRRTNCERGLPTAEARDVRRSTAR